MVIRWFIACALVSASACAVHRPQLAGGGAAVAAPKADPLQRRLDLALRARAQLEYYFIQQGAIPRPPMPALIAENAGPAPFEGAVWTPGSWAWTDGRWEWHPGHWTAPDVFTPTGGSVQVAGELDDDYGGGLDDGPSFGFGAASPTVRDHRRSGSEVRDHRANHEPTNSNWGSSSSSTATVRDHRDDKKDDKQDDDKKDDKPGDSGGRFIRDHRR